MRRRQRRGLLAGAGAAAVLVLGLVVVAALVRAQPGAGPARRHHPGPTAKAVPASTTRSVTRAGTGTTPAPPAGPTWKVSWASTMGWGYGLTSDTTIRQLVTTAVGGTAVKVRISNLYGRTPLQVGAATVAPAGVGAALAPGAVPTPLSFSGQPSTSIPPGASAYSDPAPLATEAGQRLAVSVFVADSDLTTVHPCCVTPVASYYAPNGYGNHVSAVGAYPFGYASPWSRLVDAVDTLNTAPGSIVVVGDSITDGYASGTRWTDLVQERIDMLAPAQRRAVVNEALTANTLTSVPGDDETKGGGPPGLDRLAPDALDQPGVSAVVLLLGINDLWFGAPAQQVITGLTEAAAAAHTAGVPIYAISLLPRRTGPERWTPLQQAALQAVDNWLVTSDVFNGVMDLAPAVADVYQGACLPDALFPAFDSGDHLHPSSAGDLALANAFDTAMVGAGSAPLLPAPRLVPTPGCDAVGPGFPPPQPGAPGQAPGA